MTHPYRRECSDLVSTILKRETRVIFGGESATVVPGRKGISLLLTTGARKAAEIDLCRGAVIEGLYDIADHEGVDGSMILYNIGFKFAVDPNGPLGPNGGAAQGQSQGQSQGSTNGSEKGDTRSERTRGERPGRSQSRRSSHQGYAPRGASRGPPPPPSPQPQQRYYDDGYEERLRGRFAPQRSASTRERRSYGGAYAPREEYGRDPRDRYYEYR